MPYKVHKLIEDRRNNTCGFFIPNGGFYYVIEMTFENHDQLLNLSHRPGYSVDYVEGPTGFFDADGFEVDPGTVQVNKISKLVEGYEKKMKKYGGKETPKKAKHDDAEREQVERAAHSLGIRTNGCSTQYLKQVISQKKRSPQASLSQNLS